MRTLATAPNYRKRDYQRAPTAHAQPPMTALADFAPESPLVDALIDSGHAAHAGALEHARRLLALMRTL